MSGVAWKLAGVDDILKVQIPSRNALLHLLLLFQNDVAPVLVSLPAIEASSGKYRGYLY